MIVELRVLFAKVCLKLYFVQQQPPERGLGPGVEEEQEGGEGGLRPPLCRLSPHPLTDIGGP